MFNTLGVVLYCLLGACPVFVAGTGREMSSPYRDELTLTHRVSGIHVRIVHQLLPVPFRSVPGFIASRNILELPGGELGVPQNMRDSRCNAARPFQICFLRACNIQ